MVFAGRALPALTRTPAGSNVTTQVDEFVD